jgi:hypothetical protein
MHGYTEVALCRVEGDFEGAAAFAFGDVPVEAARRRFEGSRRAGVQPAAAGQGADDSLDLVGSHAGWKPESYFSQCRDVLSGARACVTRPYDWWSGLVLALLFSR